MPNSLLILIVLALGVVGFVLGRQRALATAGGNSRNLHSLPSYYGYNVGLTAIVPALGLLIVWLLAQPMMINNNVSGIVAEAATEEGASTPHRRLQA